MGQAWFDLTVSGFSCRFTVLPISLRLEVVNYFLKHTWNVISLSKEYPLMHLGQKRR